METAPFLLRRSEQLDREASDSRREPERRRLTKRKRSSALPLGARRSGGRCYQIHIPFSYASCA
ncbi:MAG: hypothetical protein DBY36_09435 [Clostridiales bacterium]|nr:MAG: hypothetical protein DBY36_09435 [Clostridiales bacterium]